jgi:hypothetical protein
LQAVGAVGLRQAVAVEAAGRVAIVSFPLKLYPCLQITPSRLVVAGPVEAVAMEEQKAATRCFLPLHRLAVATAGDSTRPATDTVETEVREGAALEIGTQMEALEIRVHILHRKETMVEPQPIMLRLELAVAAGAVLPQLALTQPP